MEENINKLEYEGKLGKILKIQIANLLWLVLTFGIYGYWVKTETRQYIFSSFKLFSNRCKYTGTGGELFKGSLLFSLFVCLHSFLRAMLVNCSGFAYTGPSILVEYIIAILFLFCFYILEYLSYRYVFSRITWRESQIRLAGSSSRYASKKFLYTFLNIISLGLLIHRFDVAVYDYFIHQTQYGGVPFSFQKAPVSSLRRTNIITLLLTPFTLGLSRFWYWAALRRYRFNNTTIGNLRLKVTDTGAELLMLALSNMMVMLLLFGSGIAMVVASFSFDQGLLLKTASIITLLLTFILSWHIVVQRFIVYRATHTFVLGDLETFQKIQEDEALLDNVTPEEASYSDTGYDYGLALPF